MHILANIRSKICIKGLLIISSKFVTIWVVTRGGGGSRQTVTKRDKGEGRSKIGIFTVTYFLNGPLLVLIPTTKSLKCNRTSLPLKGELNVSTICTFFYNRVYIKLLLQSLRTKVAGVTYQILQRNLISCLTVISIGNKSLSLYF